MEEKRTYISAPVVFGVGTALTVGIWGGLYAGAAALFLCVLTAYLAERFGRIWGFLPALCGGLAAGMLHDRAMAEFALCADSAEYMYTIKRGLMYVPVAGAADSAYIAVLIFCGISCAVYSAAGARAAAVLWGIAAAAGSVLFGGSSLLVCGAVALAVSVLIFGAKDMRRAVLSLGAAVIALSAVLIRLPELPPAGEVSAAEGMTLYLAESYEEPHCSKAQYARGSAIMKTLREAGFDEMTQKGQLMGSAGAVLPMEEVKVGEDLIPAGVCSEYTEGGYVVCPQADKEIFRLMTQLKEGEYLDREGLYREYVYSAYGSLTADEEEKLREKYPVDGTQPLDVKLAAVRTAVRNELSDKAADSSDHAQLTVDIARSCGIAARTVKGIYFKSMPEGGKARLADGEQREWAEVYIDGAGWSVFEASREYEESSPLLPEGTSADGEESDGLTSSAEDIIYRSAPPRTAAEIRAEKETTKTSGRLMLMPFGILAAALAAGRIRAAYRWSLRRKHDDTAALKADHFQGRQLMEEVLGLHGLPPEVLAEKAEGLLGTRFAESERAYEELRFSDKAPDDKALEKAKRFYEEALRASKKQGRIKSLIRRLRGLY